MMRIFVDVRPVDPEDLQVGDSPFSTHHAGNLFLISKNYFVVSNSSQQPLHGRLAEVLTHEMGHLSAWHLSGRPRLRNFGCESSLQIRRTPKVMKLSPGLMKAMISWWEQNSSPYMVESHWSALLELSACAFEAAIWRRNGESGERIWHIICKDYGYPDKNLRMIIAHGERMLCRMEDLAKNRRTTSTDTTNRVNTIAG
jgi:hypothetical protein